MRRHRSIAFTVAPVGVLCGLICSTAAASTLLSGYGGPGAGEQVVLGSQLLNTPGGPGGAQSAVDSTLESSGPPPRSPTSSGTRSAQTIRLEGGVSRRKAAAGGADRSSRTARSGRLAPSGQLAGEVAASAQVSYDLRSGLSDEELVLIALAVVALLALTIVTRGLSRLQR